MIKTGDDPPQAFACVWDALMDTPAEAVAMRMRSDLLSAVQQAVAGWHIPLAAAAQRLEVTRPRMDDLVRGRIAKFSFDDLIGLATRIGLDVRVHITPVAP